jgi:hypothetical protein
MPSIDRFAILSQKTKDQFPRFSVVSRDKSWLRPIFWLLSKLTSRDYSGFTTTIFSTMYVGSDWGSSSSNSKYRTLRHEREHIKQFHRWPLGRWAWPVNHVLMGLAYLLVLPVIWTLRAKFEREGYTQTLLVEFELGGPISDSRMEENARWLAETFGGPTYLFMWRKKAAYAWAMETQRAINAGEISNPQDRVEAPRAA